MSRRSTTALANHSREGFLHQKLTEPRSYDYHRIRAWDDRLKMPQFRFARSRPRPGETEEAYTVREEREEGEAREAVMTFILGLTAEPIPLKYVNTPGPDRLAEVQGRKVLEKYNCIGCHQVRPGVYDVRPSKETLTALERVYQTYASDAAKKDHVFPGHDAWTGLGSPWPDRLTVYGTEAQIQPDKDTGRDALSLRLIEAMHFTNNDLVVARRAGRDDGQAAARGRHRRVAALRRGARQPAAALPERGQFGLRQGERGAVGAAAAAHPRGGAGAAEMAVPVPARPGDGAPAGSHEAADAEVQHERRRGDGAGQLFRGGRQARQSGAGITYPYLTVPQTEERYWRDQNEDYLKRLETAWPEGKGLDQRGKDLLAKMAASIQPRLDAAKAAKASATASNDEKARATAEAAALQASIDRWNYEAKQPDAYWAAANKQAESIRKLSDVREALKTTQGDEKTHKEAEEKDLQGAIDKANADFKNAYVTDLKARLAAAQDALKNAKDAEKAAKQADVDALQADVDRADKEGVVNDAAELLAQWRSAEAYPVDAYRLVGPPEHLPQVSQHRLVEDRGRQRAGPEHRLRAAAAGVDDRVDHQPRPHVRLLADDAAELPERGIVGSVTIPGVPRRRPARAGAGRARRADGPAPAGKHACEPRDPGGRHGRKVTMRFRFSALAPVRRGRLSDRVDPGAAPTTAGARSRAR